MSLTETELKLYVALQRPQTARDLVQQLNDPKYGSTACVRVHLSALRKKLSTIGFTVLCERINSDFVYRINRC